METFFAARGYPNDLIRRGRERASTKSRAEILKSDAANNIAKDRVPFVTTFHPSNLVVEKIISRNFRILREDSRTSKMFNKPPLKAFSRAKNLKDLPVRKSLPRNLPHQSPGTFPCNGTVCRTCPHVNSSSQLQHPKGMFQHGTFFLHHWTRGLLLVVHQVSIDSVHWGDWTQVGGPFSRTPQRYHQREEWPSCTCPLQPTKSYTGGHQGCGIEGRPGQPGTP